MYVYMNRVETRKQQKNIFLNSYSFIIGKQGNLVESGAGKIPNICIFTYVI